MQKQQIEAQKKDITDSIRYASDIQAAILPKEEEIQSFLPHSFVLFKPKDIVSGDFYWFHASPALRKESFGPALPDSVPPIALAVAQGKGNPHAGAPLHSVSSEARGGGLIFLAVCDCTGHGVPGAFVSMVGNDLLNQIIIEKEILNPAEVLSLLNMGMNSVFLRTKAEQHSNADTVSANRSSENPSGQNWGSEIKDGMYMVLCTFNDDLSKLEFAGARNPLYYVRDGILTEIKGDKHPIGGRTDLNCIFTKHELNLQKGDTIYMFSDGYADQLGGPREKKFMAKNIKQLLLNINDKELNEQKQILDRTNNEWKGGMDQIDDIVIIGVKI